MNVPAALSRSPEWAALVRRVHPALYELGLKENLFGVHSPVTLKEFFEDYCVRQRDAILLRKDLVQGVNKFFGAQMTGKLIIPAFRNFDKGCIDVKTRKGWGFRDWRLDPP